MKNHWLDEKKNKKLGKELEEMLMDVWGDDETVGTFMEQLTDGDNDDLYEFFTSHFLHAIDTNDEGKEIVITLRRPDTNDDID